ncbi:MAG: ATP-dependent DNA helicase RecG [Thermoanaerobaculum sp.]|nr:ATP-dependent DNA helicase RecG [Thermoanaerobaculum sp.]MDW7967247.1 ATP-dependent DNA helicase RecG [Thermoanaerobaculum sp.]
MTLNLAAELYRLPGVGSVRARQLRERGLVTVGDLLWYLPYRYEDRSSPTPIGALATPDVTVTLVGEVTDLRERRARTRALHLVEALVQDGSGAIPVVWFNQPYVARSLRRGVRLWLHGTVRLARSGWGLQLVSPEWEVEEDREPLHLGRVVPVYRRLGPASGRWLRSLMAAALARVEVAEGVLDRLLGGEYPTLAQALQQVHFPQLPTEEAAAGRFLDEMYGRTSLFHRRLALEEFAGLALVLEKARAARSALAAPRCQVSEREREWARAMLPFPLTGAQKRAVGEIVADLQKPTPMARLLQGDVGSGKTVVAALASLVVLSSGYQVAFLAPTEVLAQQHWTTLSKLFARIPFPVYLLTGSLAPGEKEAVRKALQQGSPALVVGTHALLEETVTVPRLGLAIVDEQHRFGTSQRQRLVEKGSSPHLLVMTATPIPRSLALSLYGDLEVSVLDELPPGRRPVRTVIREREALPKLLQFVREEARSGGRVYWVFPVIEGSETPALKSLQAHERTLRRQLEGIACGTVHGRLRPEERDAVMRAFAQGEIAVLFATTVIEVGLDVPEATLMVIENPERFGLAQLHQLRGRVGRGQRRSFCVLLLGEQVSREARQRLEFFASTADGFAVAEEDFRLRGPGEFTGMRQWGRPEFRAASLLLHQSELDLARTLVRQALEAGELEQLEAGLSLPPSLGEDIPPG